MWIVGLTGAMGAGKSTLSKHFKSMGIPVHCADEEIHRILEEDLGVQRKLKTLWPSVFVRGKIERSLLGKIVLSSPHLLTRLEDILYPKLAEAQRNFLQKQNKNKTPLVVLDVPLLFEVGLDRFCDCVVVAEAPSFFEKNEGS
jgi:dephospho-CoA kinase